MLLPLAPRLLDSNTNKYGYYRVKNIFRNVSLEVPTPITIELLSSCAMPKQQSHNLEEGGKQKQHNLIRVSIEKLTIPLPSEISKSLYFSPRRTISNAVVF